MGDGRVRMNAMFLKSIRHIDLCLVSSNLTPSANRVRGVVWPNIPPCHGEDHGFKSRRARQMNGWYMQRWYSRYLGVTIDRKEPTQGAVLEAKFTSHSFA